MIIGTGDRQPIERSGVRRGASGSLSLRSCLPVCASESRFAERELAPRFGVKLARDPRSPQRRSSGQWTRAHLVER